MKHAGVFNPYWDTLGGGEKYTAQVIKTLLEHKYQVSLYWPDEAILQQLTDRFDIDISGASVDPAGFTHLTSGSVISKLMFERPLDLLFWVSDGSVPLMGARTNLLHFQVPFHQVSGRSLANRLKLKLVQEIICNSAFTQQVIDQSYGVVSRVIYPPCQIIKPLPKEKIILAVGRFDGLLHNKRQDILIQSFKELHAAGWELVMAGGDMGQTNNLTRLKQQAAGLPVTWVVNQNAEVLKALYGKAAIFWHAAGFGLNDAVTPERAEHFGMATVEAMSAGAVPLVYAAGGQKEIVVDGENGRLWHTPDELIAFTRQLIAAPATLKRLSAAAIHKSRQFSPESFSYAFSQLLR